MERQTKDRQTLDRQRLSGRQHTGKGGVVGNGQAGSLTDKSTKTGDKAAGSVSKSAEESDACFSIGQDNIATYTGQRRIRTQSQGPSGKQRNFWIGLNYLLYVHCTEVYKRPAVCIYVYLINFEGFYQGFL